MTASQPTPVVLDASAVLAWRDEEPGALELVDGVVDGALLSAVNAAEVRYKAVETGDDPDALMADLRALGLQVVAYTDDHARHVPALRAIDRACREATRSPGRRGGGRRTSLSLADVACLSLALEVGAGVITGDTHWADLAAHGLVTPVTVYRDA